MYAKLWFPDKFITLRYKNLFPKIISTHRQLKNHNFSYPYTTLQNQAPTTYILLHALSRESREKKTKCV